MAEVTTGILGSQGSARTSATSARSTSKTFLFGKVAKFAIAAAVVLSLLIWWRNLPIEERSILPQSTQQTQKFSTSTQVAKQEAKWERLEADGSIPVGVWSKWIIVGDCDFGLYGDEKHHARAKFNDGSVRNLTKDSYSKGVREISVMTEIKGETGYPIKFTCP